MATVLVVDDRATNREIARVVLDDAGYHVLEASEGRRGLAVAHDSHPDVVVLDMLMPGMDGYEFVHELQADPETAAIPVLFYTSNYSDDEAQSIARAVGVSRVLQKSGDPRELLDAVDEALHAQPAPVPQPGQGVLSWQHVHAVNAKLVAKVQALDESDVRFIAMAESSPVGIFLTDLHGFATYVNPRLIEIAGVPAADLLGDGWLRCLHPDHRADVRHTTFNGQDIQRRHRDLVIGDDGAGRWLNVLIRLMRDSENATFGYFGVIDDITDVVAADEQRRTEEREHETAARRHITERLESLARLAGGVAHDFNNLLGVMLNFDQFAIEAIHEATGSNLDDTAAASILSDLGQIANAGKRAAHLTGQLLAFGRREIVTPTVVDVNHLIDEIREIISGTIGAHVTITTRLRAAKHHILADDSQLSQVLLNLAVNARDAMPDGGTLLIETTNVTGADTERLAGGHFVHLTVTDTGCGMEPDVVERAIEPFFTTKARGAGSGLGLATSYGIINQMGGRLQIQSRPGHGTTVHLYLPATDEPINTTEQETAVSAIGTETILLAEDEDGLRHAADRILVKAGYLVLTGVNGADALAVAERHPEPIDLLLTDVVMPQMDGKELATELRRQRPGLPVLYMSGYAATIMTEQGTLEPGVTVLPKPYAQSDLLRAVRTALNRADKPAR